MPVRVKGKTFGLSIQKTNAWIIPEAEDAVRHAEVAPVDEEDENEGELGPFPPVAPGEETRGMRHEREARYLAAAWQSSRQLGQPLGEGGLTRGRNVDDMRQRLKALGAPVLGTKAQFWPRLVRTEARRELQKRDEQWLADRARELVEAGGQGELRVPRAPEEPTADERARDEITHLPCQPWCAWFRRRLTE